MNIKSNNPVFSLAFSFFLYIGLEKNCSLKFETLLNPLSQKTPEIFKLLSINNLHEWPTRISFKTVKNDLFVCFLKYLQKDVGAL
jgi:hypothetical protein